MSTASNNHGDQRDRPAKSHERPQSTVADNTKSVGPLRANDADVVPPSMAAIPPAPAGLVSETPAREDSNPISFQRNAITTRLSSDERARLSTKLH